MRPGSIFIHNEEDSAASPTPAHREKKSAALRRAAKGNQKQDSQVRSRSPEDSLLIKDVFGDVNCNNVILRGFISLAMPLRV